MTISAARQAYLDWVRGVAVLIMIEAHVLDAWTRLPDRSRAGFGYAMVLGGFAAPLFLFLAGLSTVLSAESKYRRTGDFSAAWRAAQKRGWQVFGLAFLFRLQSFVLTGGYSGLSVLKVDILNVMGPAIALAAIAGSRARTKAGRSCLFIGIATAISLLAPIVRATGLLDWLPDPIEWYFRPTPGGRSNFTLFPWAGFVFAGARSARPWMASGPKPALSEFSWPWPRYPGWWRSVRTKRRSCHPCMPDRNSGLLLLRFSFSALVSSRCCSRSDTCGSEPPGGTRSAAGASSKSWDEPLCSSIGSTSRSSMDSSAGPCGGR